MIVFGIGTNIMKTDKTMQKKTKCKHKRLTFLGKQEMPTEDAFLALFNCEDCRSTISLKMVNRNFKRRETIPLSV